MEIQTQLNEFQIDDWVNLIHQDQDQDQNASESFPQKSESVEDSDELSDDPQEIISFSLPPPLEIKHGRRNGFRKEDSPCSQSSYSSLEPETENEFFDDPDYSQEVPFSQTIKPPPSSPFSSPSRSPSSPLVSRPSITTLNSEDVIVSCLDETALQSLSKESSLQPLLPPLKNNNPPIVGCSATSESKINHNLLDYDPASHNRDSFYPRFSIFEEQEQKLQHYRRHSISRNPPVIPHSTSSLASSSSSAASSASSTSASPSLSSTSPAAMIETLKIHYWHELQKISAQQQLLHSHLLWLKMQTYVEPPAVVMKTDSLHSEPVFADMTTLQMNENNSPSSTHSASCSPSKQFPPATVAVYGGLEFPGGVGIYGGSGGEINGMNSLNGLHHGLSLNGFTGHALHGFGLGSCSTTGSTEGSTSPPPLSPNSQGSFPCSHPGCGKILKSRFSLRRHLSAHSGIRPYRCTFEGCGKKFAESNTLSRHKRIHTGEKPFRCEISGCTRAFSDASNWRRHENSHSGMKPFSCPFENCEARYCRKTSLTNHIHKVHSPV